MDDRAFERAARRYKDRIHGYAMHLLRDAEEARDVAQEALVKLWQHWPKVEERGRKTWLMRTTHNLCIDRIRRRRVRGEVEGETVIPFEPDPTPGPGQLAEADELGETIVRALATLSVEDRAVVILREVQGLHYDEIASTLNMPLGTIKAKLHRARERLRGKLVRAGMAP